MAKKDINNPAQQGNRDRDMNDLDEAAGTGAEDLRGIADEEDDDFEDSEDTEDVEEEDEDEGAM